jgi:hypothetical protein
MELMPYLPPGHQKYQSIKNLKEEQSIKAKKSSNSKINKYTK